MKIIYPYPMHISNGYTYMLSIIQFLNALAELLPIDLLSLDSRIDIENYLSNNLGLELHENLNIIQTSNKKFGIKSNKIFFIHNVRKHLNKFKSEHIIVYTRDFKQMRLVIKNSNHLYPKARFIFEVHQILSQNYSREKEFVKAKEMREIENFVFSNVDGLICITSTLSSEIKRVFPNCIKNQIVLPVGFNKNFLSTSHRHNKKYDIIYSGNFSKWKGLETLIEAISIIKNEYHRNINAVLIGSNEETKNHYGDVAKKLKVFSSIKIVNRVEHKNIYDYISKSKIGVLSNNYDADGMLFTSPLKLYEYLGAGLKVVVSKLPSIESNIDESLVYYALPENSKSFAQAIIKALDDVNFDSAYVKNFAKQYTWEARAIKFKEFLNENFDN